MLQVPGYWPDRLISCLRFVNAHTLELPHILNNRILEGGSCLLLPYILISSSNLKPVATSLPRMVNAIIEDFETDESLGLEFDHCDSALG